MKSILLIFVISLLLATTVFADTVTIDFETYSEYDSVSTIATPYGNVEFYQTDTNPLVGLTVGNTTPLSPSNNSPVIAEEDNRLPDFMNLVAYTVNDIRFGGTDVYRDDYVRDPQNTGAGGKMLTDAVDTSRSKLMWHAYSMFDAIVIDVSGVGGVEGFDLVALDLDHNEKWHFQVFDNNNMLVDDLMLSESILGLAPYQGDGAAFPVHFDGEVSKIAIWGENNLGERERIGYAIDNVQFSIEPAGTGDFRTIGFWKHQFAVATEVKKGKAQIPTEVLEELLTEVSGNITLEEAYSLLWLKKATMEQRATQQCLASMLNHANSAVATYEMVDTDYDGVPDMTFEDAMDDALQGTDFLNNKNICDSINNME